MALLILGGLATLVWLFARWFVGDDQMPVLMWVGGCMPGVGLPILGWGIAVHAFRAIARSLADLGINLLASIVSFIIGIGATSLFHSIRQKRVQTGALAFWTKKTHEIFVIYGTRRPNPNFADKQFDPVDVFEIVNTNYMRAVVEASTYLNSISQLSHTTKSHNVLYTREGNLFVIGGPTANKSATEFIDRLKPNFLFIDGPDNYPKSISNASGTATYNPVFEETGTVLEKEQRKLVKDIGWVCQVVCGNSFGSHLKRG